MSISLGSSALTDLRLGTSQVSLAYLGTSLVYQSSSVTSSTWTPAQLNNLKYYFTAGAGTTLVSGRVSEWTDQVSGVKMTATVSSSAYWPQYVSSEPLANNKPALYFNSGSSRTNERLQSIVTASGLIPEDNLTVIAIIIPNSSYDSQYQIYGGIGANTSGNNYETAMWIATPSVNGEWGSYNWQTAGPANGNASSGVSVTKNIASWHAVAYNSATGSIIQYVNSSVSASTATGKVNPTKSTLKLIAGDYSDGSDGGGLGIINGKILELIYTSQIPSTTEFNNLTTYVNTYYASPSASYDADAQKFINATGISGSTAMAINAFVNTLKTGSIWTKFDVIYPFVGNSSASYAYNLVDTGSYYADWGNSNQMTFNDSTGLKMPGTLETYMNTKYNVTNLTRSNYHISFYKISGAPSDSWGAGDASNVDMGAYNESTQRGIALAAAFQTATNTIANGFNAIGDGADNNAAPSTGSMLLTGDSTHTSLYKGSTEVRQKAWTDSGAPNSGSIAIGAMTRLQEPTTAQYYHVYFTSGSWGMATIGQHISGSDATNFYNAVQSLQVSMSRQV